MGPVTAPASADVAAIAAEERYERARAERGLPQHNGTRTWAQQRAVDVAEHGADVDDPELEQLYDTAESTFWTASQMPRRRRVAKPTPAPTCEPVRRLRSDARPRERRPGRRRRQATRAGPDDLSDPDGEHDDVGRRRRGAP